MNESEVAAALAAIRADPLNDTAWSDFYAHYRGQVLGMLAMNGVGNRDVREELAAEVFYRFARYCPWRQTWRDLPAPGVIGAYIRSITENVLRTWWADVHRARQAVEHEVAIDSSENAVASADIIAKLGSTDRRFLELYVESGFSLQGTAARLSISYAAAGTRLHRIRRRIKEMARA